MILVEMSFALLTIWLQFTDWDLTRLILRLGGRELHPLIARMFEVHPLLPLAAKALMVVALFVWFAHEPMPKRLNLLAWTVFLSAIPVGWNLWQLCRAF